MYQLKNSLCSLYPVFAGCVSEDRFKLKGKMLSSNDQKLEKLDPFHRPLLSKQKTSAEIINEARNALRSVRTQRPFTPREDQRKLFGPASSRTPENRPPSSFRYRPLALVYTQTFRPPDYIFSTQPSLP